MDNKTIKVRQLIIKKLINKPLNKPVAILNVGSLVRGNSDKLSDFDFVIVWGGLEDNIWPEGACRINNQKCGIRNTTLSSLSNRDWSQIERHSYLFSKIEYDPQHIIPELIKQKCVWKKGERFDLFCETLFRLSYIVDVTDNYKNCWNERDELQMSLVRGQKLNALYLTSDFIHSIIVLALIADKSFIPSHKLCFSEWIKNISPKAYQIYKLTMDNINLIQNPNANELKRFYKPHVMNIINVFEKQEKLPENIQKYRNKMVRISKI